MAALMTLAQGKAHLRVTTTSQDGDIYLKINQASAIILRYLKGRQVAVSLITNVGAVATVTTGGAHGLTTGYSVTVWGSEAPEYNGAFVVTVTSATTFTYTLAAIPTTAPGDNVGISTPETWTDTSVPEPVQSAALLMLTHLFEHRGDDPSTDEQLWAAIARLLVSYQTPALA